MCMVFCITVYSVSAAPNRRVVSVCMRSLLIYPPRNHVAVFVERRTTNGREFLCMVTPLGNSIATMGRSGSRSKSPPPRREREKSRSRSPRRDAPVRLPRVLRPIRSAALTTVWQPLTASWWWRRRWRRWRRWRRRLWAQRGGQDLRRWAELRVWPGLCPQVRHLRAVSMTCAPSTAQRGCSSRAWGMRPVVEHGHGGGRVPRGDAAHSDVSGGGDVDQNDQGKGGGAPSGHDLR